MALTAENLEKWTVESLKIFLLNRGVPLTGGIRKADLVTKCILTDQLQLPVLSTVPEKVEEIQTRREQKLKDGYVQIPFPEELTSGWFSDLCYYPDLTLDCLKDYAKRSVAEKAFKEGLNLNNGNHVSHVEFNNIAECLKYCFIRGEVVPQTRIGESRYKVWVCLSSISCAVLTGECGCAAGFSEACKHVFALLHHIEHHVTLGHNKTCTSKEQIWNKTIDKKGEKIHRPAVLSEITFDRPHPEYEADYVRRKRSTFDPRPLQNRASCPINWNKLHATSGGHSFIHSMF